MTAMVDRVTSTSIDSDLLVLTRPVKAINTETCSNSNCDFKEDTFETLHKISIEIEKPPSLLKKFVGIIVDALRLAWKFIRRFNPLTQFFNFVESVRCARYISQAASRNGARTEKELIAYHQSLRFNESCPDDKKLYKAHLPKSNESRPLIAIFLGNSQTHMSPTKTAGMNELYNQLKDEGYDVVAFRAGRATCDLKGRFLFGDCSENTGVYFENTANILEDIISSKGSFIGRKNPSKVILIGYSFGGGTIDKLMGERWQKIAKDIPISTACVDPIELGANDLGSAVTERPKYSKRHLVFYQQNSCMMNGRFPYKIRQGDMYKEVINSNHETIDNNPEVQEGIYRFVQSEIVSN